MTKRKGISKKIRFEVFKRDSFSCQYCGKSAPDVVLNLDHIHPVAKGGTNEILNLVTSCFDCNSGKSDKVLSDGTILRKQMAQAKSLSERREQLKMMADWKLGLNDILEESLNTYNDYLSKTYEFCLSEYGLGLFRKTIQQYGLAEVLESTDKSARQYLHDNKAKEQRAKFLDYIPKICYWQKREKENPEDAELRKLAYVANRKWFRCSPQQLQRRLFELNQRDKLTPKELYKLIYSSTGIMSFEDNVRGFLEANHV